MNQTITLPWPPSVNTYWRSIVTKGRPRTLISKNGRAYRKVIQQMAIIHRWKRHGNARLDVTILARPPDRRKRDIDNLLKATLDSLCEAGIYADDSQVDKLTVERGQTSAGGALVITIKTLDAA